MLTGGPRDLPDAPADPARDDRLELPAARPGEAGLFRGLAVFAGGWTPEAAAAVCGAGLDELAALLDQSLLRRGDEGRFRMLETVRAYSDELLRDSP